MKKRRKELKFSSDYVARSIGVSPSTYREWENGRKIQGEPYLKIAEVLEIPLAVLLGAELSESEGLLLKDLESIENNIRNIKNYLLKI